MPLEIKALNKKKVGFFRFKQLNKNYLITNDIGQYCILEPRQFELFIHGDIEQVHPEIYQELQSKGFIRDKLDFSDLSRKYSSRNKFLGKGVSLHIVVVTLRCDHRCVYCQASSESINKKELDMNTDTAKHVVDRIFESSSKNITIEFQGGEPLLNFDVIKFIVSYAIQKNQKAKKDLFFTVISNLTFFNEKILKYLINNKISICTSLDGPERLHNKHRVVFDNRNTYKNTVKWLGILVKEYKKERIPFVPSALITITRHSLNYSKEIVNEYMKLGLNGIHLRPVNPYGMSVKIWKKLNFSAEDFIRFYVNTIDYIIGLNLKGINFHERFAKIFLTKILTTNDPNYLDIRSPCGAGIGQLAYNFNGDVYTCDEGRMLSRMGDESFKIGNARDNCYDEIISNQTVKTMCIASCLDNLSECYNCVYKPYCGVCPLYNYLINNDIFNKAVFVCKINRAILDYLFERLQHKNIANIFYKWA